MRGAGGYPLKLTVNAMEQQLSMLDLWRPAPIQRGVDPDGMVVEGHIHTVLRLPHPRSGDRARIEVHPHERLWMWATAFQIGTHGSGYRVGPKWGRFANSMEDAIFWAVRELQKNLAVHRKSKGRDEIIRWLALYEPVNWKPDPRPEAVQ